MLPVSSKDLFQIYSQCMKIFRLFLTEFMKIGHKVKSTVLFQGVHLSIRKKQIAALKELGFDDEEIKNV